MRRFIASGFVGALLSVRTVCAALLVGAFGLYNLSQVSGSPGLNAWDLAIPSLTDTVTTNMIGLAWWVSWLLPAMHAVGQEQSLIRFGSLARAVRLRLAGLMGALGAWAFWLVIICVMEDSSLGFASAWSESALAGGSDQPSAFSAASLARVFVSPGVAVVFSAVYTGVGYLAVGSVALALHARGYHRLSVIGLVFFLSWAIIGGFSPAPITPMVDPSVPLSLGWASATPGGLWLGGSFFFVAFAFASAMSHLPHLQVSLRAALASRPVSVLSLVGVVAIASVNATFATPEGVSPVRQFFSGAFGDMVSYVLVAAVPLGFTTGFLVRVTEVMEGPLLYEALRRGSYRGWLGKTLFRELLLATVLCLLTGAALLATLTMAGHRISLMGQDGADLAVGLLGLFTSISLLTAICSLLMWTGTSLSIAWPVTAGVALILGHWVPANLEVLNISAPYSLPTDSATLTVPLIAIALTCVVAAAVVTAAMRLATPARAYIFI